MITEEQWQEKGFDRLPSCPPIIFKNQLGSATLLTHVASFLMEQGINIFIPSATSLNQLNPKFPHNNPDTFWYPGGVTVSRVHRAKGNEADMVYVVGFDNVAKDESNITLNTARLRKSSRLKPLKYRCL